MEIVLITGMAIEITSLKGLKVIISLLEHVRFVVVLIIKPSPAIIDRIWSIDLQILSMECSLSLHRLVLGCSFGLHSLGIQGFPRIMVHKGYHKLIILH